MDARKLNRLRWCWRALRHLRRELKAPIDSRYSNRLDLRRRELRRHSEAVVEAIGTFEWLCYLIENEDRWKR